MLTIDVAILKNNEEKSRGFIAELCAAGKCDGDTLTVDNEAFARIWAARFRPRRERRAEPSLRELAQNFSIAIARWASAGFPVVDEDTYRRRADICAQCMYWDDTARAGIGRCNAPGCGCTRFKRWLATERCPLDLWNVVDNQAHTRVAPA